MIKTDNVQLMFGDCLERMKEIESGSVDLIVCDLPYGNMKNQPSTWDAKDFYWDTVIDTKSVMIEADRILRKNGKMCLFAQDPFSTELRNKAIPNLPYNYSAIWEKDNFANALLAKKAMVNYYEDILVFSKTHDYEAQHPLRAYFNEVLKFIGLKKSDIIKKVGQCADHTFRVNCTQYRLCTELTYNKLQDEFSISEMDGFKPFLELIVINDEFNKRFNSVFNLPEGAKYKSNILKYKKDYTGLHPTQKPVALLEDLIKTFSNEGNLVVDMTMGSGSTGVACVNTGRKFTGIELDPTYYGIACERIL